ncbi:hypothetical protein NERG_02703 [Nematocida ausubeli]|uniref:Uncharacterized protein n=1 Tax=Nematocida ausubeli (strain ATCC PRA-371 / ERTm2) TaxID=1913371 RepID=H8ZGI2_NEMA1|nr:hypothetical protein NERG_02703 [Nematocida ausubeli]
MQAWPFTILLSNARMQYDLDLSVLGPLSSFPFCSHKNIRFLCSMRHLICLCYAYCVLYNTAVGLVVRSRCALHFGLLFLDCVYGLHVPWRLLLDMIFLCDRADGRRFMGKCVCRLFFLFFISCVVLVLSCSFFCVLPSP